MCASPLASFSTATPSAQAAAGVLQLCVVRVSSGDANQSAAAAGGAAPARLASASAAGALRRRPDGEGSLDPHHLAHLLERDTAEHWRISIRTPLLADGR